MQHRFTSFAFASVLGVLVLATTPSLSLAHSPTHPYAISGRLHNQQHRIVQGVREGQLSPAETSQLEREEFGIRRARYRMRHDDGHLGPEERARLQHRLNEASQDIYQDRHN